MSFVTASRLSIRITNVSLMASISFTAQLKGSEIAKISKLSKPDHLSRANVAGCEYLNQISFSETRLEESIDFRSFSVRVYPPLIQKDSLNHIYGLAVICAFH